MNNSLLRSFRLVCPVESIPLVEALLRAQGFDFQSEAVSIFVRRLTREPFPLGASLAARFGYIYIQDLSSMLPPCVLAPDQGSAVLDMCASPGSKTGFLGQLVGAKGFVLGNEPSMSRLGTLRSNLEALNLLQCATASYGGEAFPLPQAESGGWPFIQLDPPCSGWGTVEKNPQVLALWQGEKVKPLIQLQRKLLARAKELLAPGGSLVYSTCTTNPAENEEQLRFACEELGFLFVPVEAPAGYAVEPVYNSDFAGALRLQTTEGQQGFFVAKLMNPARQGAKKKEDGGVGEGMGAKKFRQRKVILEGVHPEALWSEFVMPEALPPGQLGAVNGVVYFLPQAAKRLLMAETKWRGYALGKMQKSGQVKVFPGLRCLMPSVAEAKKRQCAVLDVDEPAVLEQLLTGRSIHVAVGHKVIGLYFQGLPLCTMLVKGTRALLPAL